MLTMIGLVANYLGFGCVLYGLYKNNDFRELLNSAMQNNTLNPGDKWILAGIIVVLLGTVLILIHAFKKPKRKKSKFYPY
ncbi:MAG: hypothetical protein ACK5JF_12895 [Oscillospiraceae bacterium]